MSQARILFALFFLALPLSSFFADGLPLVKLEQAAPPRSTEEGILFTFKSPDAQNVYLAGSFNNWADNKNGAVTDLKYAMTRSEKGIWFKIIRLEGRVHRYKFVVTDKKGRTEWHSDPTVSRKDRDQNTVVDFYTVIPSREKVRLIVPGRRLKPLKTPVLKKDIRNILIREMRLDEIWGQPGFKNRLIVTFENSKNRKPGTYFLLNIMKFSGETVKSVKEEDLKEWWGMDIDTKGFAEGGWILLAELWEKEKLVDMAFEVLTVANEISDDLRYGFYARWDRMGADYNKKASLFARLHINAVEYYDYFPAHGNYAPVKKTYRFEPLGKSDILAEDIQRKIHTARERNILSLAYTAAYAASRSVYEKHPYPMTDKNGRPLIFNGRIMTEEEALASKKPVWFRLMAVAPDTPWYSYIIPEFEKTLDNTPGDLVSFDGLSVDCYGHSASDAYYSPKSAYSGQPLSRVLRGFVGNLRMTAHKLKKPAAVTFNSVNEYAVREMADVADFLFIENWASHRSEFEGLTDLCYSNRRWRNQRVILKIYPSDTELGVKHWPGEHLKHILAAAMAGGGSVMTAGEPDERKEKMYGLNTLYYPDCTEMPDENFDALRRYHLADSILYRLTHGKNVVNMESPLELPDCIIRGFDASLNAHGKYMVFTLFHAGQNREWTRGIKKPPVLENYEIAFKIPDNKRPLQVLFCSPDLENLVLPRNLDWEQRNGYLRTSLPWLDVFGVLLVRYK